MIQGNADRELVALRWGEEIEIPDDVTPWAAEQLTEQHVQLLDGLPHPLGLPVEGFGPVAFCHGSPRRDDELVLVDSPMSRWARAFADLAPDQMTVVCGHTHMPFVRLVDRRLVINPGSIGMPYGRAGGSWVLLENGNVSLRHTDVDLDEAVRAVVDRSTYPGRAAWAEEYIRAANSDADERPCPDAPALQRQCKDRAVSGMCAHPAAKASQACFEGGADSIRRASRIKVPGVDHEVGGRAQPCECRVVRRGVLVAPSPCALRLILV